MRINDNTFLFHIEAQDADKPQGLLGVEHEQSRMTVTGDVSPKTWQQIETLVRFAAK